MRRLCARETSKYEKLFRLLPVLVVAGMMTVSDKISAIFMRPLRLSDGVKDDGIFGYMG